MREDFRNILVVKMSSMGDVLHALPAICLLRDRFPAARISWLIDHRFASLVTGHPAVDEFLLAPTPPWIERLGPMAHIARGAHHLAKALGLGRRSFDLVVDLQGLFKTGVLTAATRAKRRLGFANAREAATLFYNQSVRVPLSLHAVRRYVQLVETVTGPASQLRFDLPVSLESRQRARRVLHATGIGGDYVVVAPRSSRREKNWPLARFSEVTQAIWQNNSLPSVIIGGVGDRSDCEAVSRESQTPAAVIVGESLSTVTAILRQARLLIGLDSGPIHLAAALGRPVVSIFGPTDPVRFAPWGSEHLVVRQSVDCRTCRAAKLIGSLAHKAIPHQCMDAVSSEQVMAKVNEEFSRPWPRKAAG